MAWCKAQGYCDADPFASVVGQGRRVKGKAQLTNDEARKFLAKGLELGGEGDAGAIAAVTVLLLAIRAGECAAIKARDLDDGGRVLRIPRSKTEAGIRRVAVPEVLRSLLKSIAPDLGPVFGGKDRHWVRYSVGRLCGLAEVPVVTAHGLRGTHATLATGAGASSEAVAASLGHATTKVTEESYIAPGAVGDAKARRVLEVLGGMP
jgi:integrase